MAEPSNKNRASSSADNFGWSPEAKAASLELSLADGTIRKEGGVLIVKCQSARPSIHRTLSAPIDANSKVKTNSLFEGCKIWKPKQLTKQTKRLPEQKRLPIAGAQAKLPSAVAPTAAGQPSEQLLVTPAISAPAASPSQTALKMSPAAVAEQINNLIQRKNDILNKLMMHAQLLEKQCKRNLHAHFIGLTAKVNNLIRELELMELTGRQNTAAWKRVRAELGVALYTTDKASKIMKDLQFAEDADHRDLALQEKCRVQFGRLFKNPFLSFD